MSTVMEVRELTFDEIGMVSGAAPSCSYTRKTTKTTKANGDVVEETTVEYKCTL